MAYHDQGAPNAWAVQQPPAWGEASLAQPNQQPPAAQAPSAWAQQPQQPPPQGQQPAWGAPQPAWATPQQHSLQAQEAQPLPEEPTTLTTRVRLVASLFLLASGLSALSGSIPSALYALFLYFGVIRGIPRGNRKALGWFSCCSACGAIVWVLVGLVVLATTSALMGCACAPACVAARWDASRDYCGGSSSSGGGGGGGGRKSLALTLLPLAHGALAPALPLPLHLQQLLPHLHTPQPQLGGQAGRHRHTRSSSGSSAAHGGNHTRPAASPHSPPAPALLPLVRLHGQQPPGPPLPPANCTVDAAQREAALQCSLRGLYYFIGVLLLALGVLHTLAWRWSKALGAHPWMLAMEALTRQRSEALRLQQQAQLQYLPQQQLYQQQFQQQQQQQQQLYTFTPGVGFSPVVMAAAAPGTAAADAAAAPGPMQPVLAPQEQQQQQQQQQHAMPPPPPPSYVPPPYVPYRGEDGVFGDLGEQLQNNVVHPLRNFWMGMRNGGAAGATYVPVGGAVEHPQGPPPPRQDGGRG